MKVFADKHNRKYLFQTAHPSDNNGWRFHFRSKDIESIQRRINENFDNQYIHFNIYSPANYGPAIDIFFDREEDENFFKVLMSDGIEI